MHRHCRCRTCFLVGHGLVCIQEIERSLLRGVVDTGLVNDLVTVMLAGVSPLELRGGMA